MKGARTLKRKSINSQKDPYLLKSVPEDMSSCRKCGAVYHDKRWMSGKDAERLGMEPRASVLCPACQKVKDGFAGGFVTLQGEFLREHRDEIMNLVRNKEERASRINPLERIMEIKESKGAIEITTTTDKFAQRLGRILSKAFNGAVEYKWSADTKLARVVWTRN